jgi:hypothetical protein
MLKFFSENIDIGFLVKKARTNYYKDRTNIDKQNKYTEIYYEYYKIIVKIYIEYSAKYKNIKVNQESDDADVRKIRNNVVQILSKINQSLTLTKNQKQYKINKTLYDELIRNNFLISNNSLLSNDEKIQEYEKLIKIAELVVQKRQELENIEKENYDLENNFKQNLEDFDGSDAAKPEFEKYKESVKEKKTELIQKIQNILTEFNAVI